MLAFGGTILFLASLVGADLLGALEVPLGPSSQFGGVAMTTFAIAGSLAVYRAWTIRSSWAAAIAVVLLLPGAVWSWSTFVGDQPASGTFSSLVAVSATGTALVLLTTGLRRTQWREVFAGLGAMSLATVAGVVLIEPEAIDTALPALLAAVAGMTCLYGLLVDLEVAEHRSLTELIESRKQIEDEVSRVEDLLHDLRSGLLAIESAIGTVDGDLAAPLRAEAARLRRLTLDGTRTVERFDLADRVRSLVAAHRAGGALLTYRGPDHASAWGEESEVLAIVDNLVSNAERHGSSGPIVVGIDCRDAVTKLSVSSRGRLPDGDPEAIFQRGVTTHPDGKGLGLARARMLAGVNHADLRVAPGDVDRTTFVLTLLAEPPEAVA